MAAPEHAGTPTLTAFERSPDRGRGLARDMRVRWALEEVGQPYDVRLMTFETLKQPAHLRLNPFGQIPTWQEGDLTLFESGAIVLHLSERHGGLLPDGADARARAIAWMFAALNTVEPSVFDRALTMVLERDRPWFADRMKTLEERIAARLDQLSAHLGKTEWLDGDFSAGDLLMASVLMRLKGSPLLDERPNIEAFLARAEDRPAFQRAFAAQQAAFAAATASDPS